MVSGAYAAALVEWRETIGDIYKEIRSTHARDPSGTWERFRERRDFLYKHHPCSALTESEKLTFTGFENYSYNPDLCFVGRVEYEANGKSYEASTSEGALPCRRIAIARFEHRGKSQALSIFWLDIYGGGIWLPVGDQTNGDTTYAGGRYLFDTSKGANLGFGDEGKNILLDMNFLYPPSCSLNAQWVCPLSPPENRLTFPVEAGETIFGSGDVVSTFIPASDPIST
jgi:uncharacterized protein